MTTTTQNKTSQKPTPLILSHYRAGTGAVLVETREESRLLRQILSELPSAAQVCTVAAPSEAVKDARTGRPENGVTGLAGGISWAQAAPGRLLLVYDFHTLINSAGHWRKLIDALPGLRSPKGAGASDPASLVVFVGPSWELTPANPLRGAIPVLRLPAIGRESLRAIAASLHTLNGDAEAVLDALGGLDSDVAEQAAAECLAARKGTWDPAYLRGERARLLRSAGLELWPSVADLGGLSGFRDYVTQEVVPWVRDPQLAVRRILCAGLPGTGKSYGARWIGQQLNTETVRLSISGLKAGIVGASEQALRRALSTIDSLSMECPLVVVIDEIDTIAREGLDGGTSSGMFAELLTWLQESKSMALVVATLNRLDKLDAALESRFQARFFYDLGGLSERRDVARIHFTRLGCDNIEEAALAAAQATEGWSSREIAEYLCPSVARRTKRKPTSDSIMEVCEGYSPASRTQTAQLDAMRHAASSLRRANDPAESHRPSGRRIAGDA